MFPGEQVTDQWYSEAEKYNFNGCGGGGGTGEFHCGVFPCLVWNYPKLLFSGHFTQVVWKSSKELGVGRARTQDGKWLVVANYLPAGNFMGKYKENVMPPKDGKIVIPKREAPEKGKKRKKKKSSKCTIL